MEIVTGIPRPANFYGMAVSRRQEALALAEELLSDIELSRLPPMEVARKTSRLARLLDDEDGIQWLSQEVGGYQLSEDGTLGPIPWAAALRSHRVYTDSEGTRRATTTLLGELGANIDAAMAQIGAAADRPVSVSSANPNQFVMAPAGNTAERSSLRNFVGQQKGVLDKVVGALYEYVVARYQELRFGAAVESAFEIVRARVDADIANLIPDALPKLSAALENASSDNPEQWANAAAGCRRLLKAAADALRPPGPPVDGHAMDEDHYVNRLVAWITEQATSETGAKIIEADLQYLDRRLHAAVKAGHKGAHDEVDRSEAARYVTGTYLILGDILRLRSQASGPDQSSAGGAVAAEELNPIEPEPETAPPSPDEGDSGA